MEQVEPYLSGMIAVVTGAGKGIGRGFVSYLASRGAEVYAVSRTEADLILLKSENVQSPGIVHGVCLDVRDFEAQCRLSVEIENKHKRLDILVVNAGVDIENRTVEQSSVEKWETTVNINLIGSYKTVRSMLSSLKQSKSGKLILIGSGLGHRGIPSKSAYSVSKAGMWMFTRILAQELIDYGISVNEVIPGPVKTEIDRTIKIEEKTISNVFNNEWNKEPKDIEPLLEFLLKQGNKGPTGQSFSLARRDIY